MKDFTIRPAEEEDRNWIREILIKLWSSTKIVSKGNLHEADTYEALIASCDQQRSGLLVYHIRDQVCEIISLNREIEQTGIATNLLNHLKKICNKGKCCKIIAITTNDNTPALRFYQKNGFRIKATRKNAIGLVSRKIKPEIPLTGVDGIEIRDEIEMEYLL